MRKYNQKWDNAVERPNIERIAEKRECDQGLGDPRTAQFWRRREDPSTEVEIETDTGRFNRTDIWIEFNDFDIGAGRAGPVQSELRDCGVTPAN